MSAAHFDLPAELEALLLDVCHEHGVPARQHDELRMLLQRPPSRWPICCGSNCRPCVDDQARVAREVLARWAPRPLDFQR